MIAAQHGKVAARIGIVTLLDVLHPSAVNSDRDIMFFFAGDRACMTTDATILIDDEAVAHSRPF
jgi:hypothetical protein